jgi:hypothetical protein
MAPKTKDVDIRESFQLAEASIDRKAGTIDNVAILGRESENGWDYSDEAMQDLVELLEGGPMFMDHPADGDATATRRMRDFLGKTVDLRKEGGKVKGKLVLVDQVEKICNVAEKTPELVGCSVNIRARTRMRSGERDLVERILIGRSTDLVIGPASNRSLFEQNQDVGRRRDNTSEEDSDAMEFPELTIEVLEQKRPDLVLALKDQGKASSDEAQRIKDLTEQVATLTKAGSDKETKIATMEAEQKLRDRTAHVDKMIMESKLPKEAITDALRQSLITVEEDEKVTEILEGLKKVAGLSGEPEADESDPIRDIQEGRKGVKAFADDKERDRETEELRTALTTG